VENVIPYIPGEEEKVQKETQKIMGRMDSEGIVPAQFPVSATCTRVGVLDGHTEAVFVATEKPVSPKKPLPPCANSMVLKRFADGARSHDLCA
jgi:aspartate-semialdehyde dehydrogenase